MDAVKFLEEVKRMCDNTACEVCRIPKTDFGNCSFICVDNSYKRDKKWMEHVVATVEKWSTEHPRKTRLMDFLEKHPSAPKLSGYPIVLPIAIGYCGEYGHNEDFCHQCPNFHLENRKCWDMPLEG